MRHDELSEQLQRWQLTNSIPSRMSARVWAEIRRREANRGIRSFIQTLLQGLDDTFTKPKWAISYATALVTIGVLAGNIHGKYEATSMNHGLSARYAQSIDPYQAQFASR